MYRKRTKSILALTLGVLTNLVVASPSPAASQVTDKMIRSAMAERAEMNYVWCATQSAVNVFSWGDARVHPVSTIYPWAKYLERFYISPTTDRTLLTALEYDPPMTDKWRSDTRFVLDRDVLISTFNLNEGIDLVIDRILSTCPVQYEYRQQTMFMDGDPRSHKFTVSRAKVQKIARPLVAARLQQGLTFLQYLPTEVELTFDSMGKPIRPDLNETTRDVRVKQSEKMGKDEISQLAKAFPSAWAKKTDVHNFQKDAVCNIVRVYRSKYQPTITRVTEGGVSQAALLKAIALLHKEIRVAVERTQLQAKQTSYNELHEYLFRPTTELVEIYALSSDVARSIRNDRYYSLSGKDGDYKTQVDRVASLWDCGKK
jgi:hypothetical protein